MPGVSVAARARAFRLRLVGACSVTQGRQASALEDTVCDGGPAPGGHLIRDGAKHLVSPASLSDDALAAIPDGDAYFSGLVPVDAILAPAGSSSRTTAQSGPPPASILATGPASASAAPATTTTPTAAPTTAPAQATLPSSVNVGLGEWGITPDSTTLASGKVTFDVTDTGKGQHEMVLIKSDKDLTGLPVSRATVDESAVRQKIDEIEDFKAGDHKSATFALEPGAYILICNLANHYNKGMVAQITVQ
jgi:uncharacterized cupredoxin-like copper-binding protein